MQKTNENDAIKFGNYAFEILVEYISEHKQTRLTLSVGGDIFELPVYEGSLRGNLEIICKLQQYYAKSAIFITGNKFVRILKAVLTEKTPSELLLDESQKILFILNE